MSKTLPGGSTDLDAGMSLLQFHTEDLGSILVPAKAEFGQLTWSGKMWVWGKTQQGLAGSQHATAPQAPHGWDDEAWRRHIILSIARSIQAAEGGV